MRRLAIWLMMCTLDIVRDQDTPDDGLTRGPTDGIPWEKLRVLEKSAF